jgi:hypothetical protein
MKEKENFGGICITFRKGEEIEVVVSNIEVLDSNPVRTKHPTATQLCQGFIS